MESSLVIALVAITISLFSIGLLFSMNANFQSQLSSANSKLDEQGRQMDALSTKLGSVNNQLQSVNQTITAQGGNLTSVERRLNLLGDQVTKMQQARVSPSPPIISPTNLGNIIADPGFENNFLSDDAQALGHWGAYDSGG